MVAKMQRLKDEKGNHIRQSVQSRAEDVFQRNREQAATNVILPK